MIYGVGCGAVIEPVVTLIFEGDATMVYEDGVTLDITPPGTELIPGIFNGTDEGYHTNDPWDDIDTSVLLAPAMIEALISHQSGPYPPPLPTEYNWNWGSVANP